MTVVVTGGGNGIGRELVFELLRRNARVAALDISETGLAETSSLAGAAAERLSTHVVDITDRQLVDALPEAVRATHGQVDGVINCAGIIQPFVKVNALEYPAIERVMNINFWGLLYVTKAFLPKRTSMAHVTQADLDAIAHKLNTRPRKRLGFRTPEECYA